MRAWRYQSFGPVATVARLAEIPAPRPAAGQALVRVHWVSINPLDWKLVEGQFRWLAKSRPPCGIGTEFSGEVVEPGSGGPAPGSRVIGFINPFAQPPGALQELVALPAAGLVPLAAGVAEEQGCTLPVAGLSALQMCRMAGIAAGQRVLVHGAAGGVGSFAVQVLRALGALPVATGSDASQALLQRLQPQACIDYTLPVERWGGPFDAILDCSTSLTPASVRRLLAPRGRYVSTLPRFPGVLLDPLLNPLRRRRRMTLRLSPEPAGLQKLMQWIAAGRLAPLISERFELAQALQALARVRTGRARGKLVVRVA